jgi:hypothetical protein
MIKKKCIGMRVSNTQVLAGKLPPREIQKCDLSA